jgi:membrane associated rhomboid family serine protease
MMRSNLYPRGLRFFEKILLFLVPIASAFASPALGQSAPAKPNIIIISTHITGFFGALILMLCIQASHAGRQPQDFCDQRRLSHLFLIINQK